MKKFSSMLLVLVFMLTLVPVIPAMAANVTVATEDFDDSFEINANSWLISGLEIFKSAQPNGTITQTDDGYSGKALKVSATETATSTSITGKSFVTDLAIDTTKSFVYTARIKFTGTPESNFNMTFGYGSTAFGIPLFVGVSDGKYIAATSSGNIGNGTFLDNEWHRMVVQFKLDENTANNKFQASLYNSKNELVWNRNVAVTDMGTNAARCFAYSFANLNTNSAVLIDDAAFYSLTADSTFAFDALNSTAANSTVALSDEITLSFDQPVAAPATSMFTVTDSENTTVSGAIASAEAVDFKTVKVSLKGLSFGESYTLDFSGVKSALGEALTGTTTLSFATAQEAVFEENFDDTQFSAENAVVSASYTNAAATVVAGHSGNALSFSATTAGTAGSVTLTGKSFAEIGLAEDKLYVYTQRMKFTGTPESNFSLGFDDSDGGYHGWPLYVGVNNGEYVFASSNNALASGVAIGSGWYRAVTKLFYKSAGTDTESISDDMYRFESTVYDENNAVVWTRAVEGPYSRISSRSFRHLISNLNTESAVILDDAKLYCLNTASTMALDAENSTAANTAISANGSITLCFDQPVAPTANKFTVKDSAGAAVSGAVASVEIIDFTKVKVNLTGLKAGSSYTLDFSQVTSVAGSSIDGTNTLAFKTEYKDIYEEDFSGFINHEYLASGSEIFYKYETRSRIREVEGYNGTNGIELYNSDTTAAKNNHLQMNTYGEFGLDDNTSLIMTIRFMLKGNVEQQVQWYLNPGEITKSLGVIFGQNGKYYLDNAEDKELFADKWYNMSLIFNKTGSNELMIADEETGAIVAYKTSTVPSDMPSKAFMIQANTSYAGLPNGTTLTLSDAKIYRIKKGETTYSVTAKEGAGETIDVDGSVSLTFDKPVFGRMLKENAQALNAISVDKGAKVGDIKVHNFNKAIISFNSINYLTDYTLDCSGMYLTGAVLDPETDATLSFSTGADPKYDVTMKGRPTLSGTSAGDTITLSLYSRAGAAPVILVGLYDVDGAFLGAEIFTEDTQISADSLRENMTYTLKNTYENAETARIFIWDGVGTLRPLMRSEDGAFL